MPIDIPDFDAKKLKLKVSFNGQAAAQATFDNKNKDVEEDEIPYGKTMQVGFEQFVLLKLNFSRNSLTVLPVVAIRDVTGRPLQSIPSAEAVEGFRTALTNQVKAELQALKNKTSPENHPKVKAYAAWADAVSKMRVLVGQLNGSTMNVQVVFEADVNKTLTKVTLASTPPPKK